MKCEICHEAEAETVFEDGAGHELFVCKPCAADAMHRQNSAERNAEKDEPQVTIVNASGEEPPQVVKAFLQATAEFLKGLARTDLKKQSLGQCPQCGMKWKDAKKNRLLGCPHCYETFADRIEEAFLRNCAGKRHVDHPPEKVASADVSRAYLIRELKDALAREDYRKAAQLKREIDQLDGGTEDSSK
ncbi:MAG: hypothetical protein IJ802_06975 [Kiritimatiellae bacterium]|nr:hypothetical protein [Kiritimatiellia bacterium]